MNLKVILLLAISLLISGCIDNQENSLKLTTSRQYIPDSFTEISNKLAMYGSSCSSMTKIQCDNLRNSYIGKYVKWRGTTIDVKDDSVYVSVIYQGKTVWNTINEVPHEVVLHDVKNKTQLMNLNKNQAIEFSGQIKNVLDNVYNNEVFITEFEVLGQTNLYNVEITETILQPISTQVPIVPENIKYSNKISYHIDTKPSGNSILYINGIESQKRGELPPGSYIVKIVLANNKVYAYQWNLEKHGDREEAFEWILPEDSPIFQYSCENNSGIVCIP